MKINVRFEFDITSKVFLGVKLTKLGIPHLVQSPNEDEIDANLSPKKMEMRVNGLGRYGIKIIAKEKTATIQRIKFAINEILYDHIAQLQMILCRVAHKLNYSYTSQLNLFSGITFTPIKNFIIIPELERSKELMAANNLIFPGVPYRLKYSSLVHLSGQFNKTTDLIPTAFLKILKIRKVHSIQT